MCTLRQRLREVAVALVGDDDRGAGLGDQEVGAGDADIGGEEFLAQDLRAPRRPAASARPAARSAGRCVCRRRKSASTWSWVRWMAGAMMWLGVSPRIWMRYSPRSVSTDLDAVALERGR